MKTYIIPKTGEIYEVSEDSENSEEINKTNNNYDLDSNTSNVLASDSGYASSSFSINDKNNS